MKLKKTKFISLLCAATLLSSPILTQVAYAVEAEKTEATSQEVQAENQTEETPIVQQPEIEMPVVEEIEMPKAQLPIPEVEAQETEEVLPPEGVRPLPKPDVTETAEKDVVDTPTAKVGDVTVIFNLDVDGIMYTGGISGPAGEAFAIPINVDIPATHTLWLVEFAGDANVQMEVLGDGTLYFTGVYPSVDTTYNAVFTVKEVAADVQVNYINQTTGEPIPTAPNSWVGGAVGESVTIDAVQLVGYDLVSAPSQTVIISTEEQEITFEYVEITTPVETIANVYFVDENGLDITGGPLTHITGLGGEEVDFVPPVLPGYVYDGPATLEVPADGSDVIVGYKRIDITLTISHVDENGVVLTEDQKLVQKIGDSGIITPAVIPGYTFVGVKSTSTTKLAGTLSKAVATTVPYTFKGVDETIVFEYSKNISTDPGLPGKPGNPGQPGKPGTPTPPPVIDDGFASTSNVNDTPADDADVKLAPKDTSDELPKTGEVENTIATSIGAAMIVLFFGFISRFKKNEDTL